MSRSDEEVRWQEIKRKEDAEKSRQKFLNSLTFSESQLYYIEKEISSMSGKLDVLDSFGALDKIDEINTSLYKIKEENVKLIKRQEESLIFIDRTNDLLKIILIALIILILVVLIRY